MKVLILTNMYPSKGDPSFGVFVKNQVESLMKLEEVAITLVANCNNKRGLFPSPLKYVILSFRFILAMLKSNFDIIHAHYIFPTGLMAVLPKIVLRKKLIISAHGSDVHTFPVRNKIALMITKFVLAFSDLIIANSDAMSQQIRSLKVPSKKIQVIRPSDVDSNLFKVRNREQIRKKMGIHPSGHILLYVGRLSSVKGLKYLLEAVCLLLSQSNDVRLYIVGDGPEKSSLISLTKELGIDRQVYFMGYKNHTDIPFWLNSADIFILPSLREGFGMVALEAMACALPVVASNVGGIAEIVKNDINGYTVKPAQPWEIAEKLTRIIDNPKLRTRLSKGALKTAIKYQCNSSNSALLASYKLVHLGSL